MGLGCRRDPLEANMWYVRAADQGDERAKYRIAAIRAAASGGPPVHVAAAAPPSVLASPKKEKVSRKRSGVPEAEKEKEKEKEKDKEREEEDKGKGKRWGIF